MAADYIVAIAAVPFLFLIFQKTFDSVFPDEFEVFYHAQMVFRAVAFIKGFQTFTGEVMAFVTESHQSFAYKLAVAAHKDAVLAARPAAFTVRPFKTLTVQVLFLRKIADA